MGYLKVRCDICTASMVLKDDLGYTQKVKGTGRYRRRRFICSVPGCGYMKMVFGGGERDDVHIPNQIFNTAERWNSRGNKNITE